MRKMTKLAGLALAASMLASTAYAAEKQAAFDFEKDDCGFIPIYVDYPGGEGVDELTCSWGAIRSSPASGRDSCTRST